MSQTSIRIIITGATGMVGEGVLHVCLQRPDVDAILLINRKPSGVSTDSSEKGRSRWARVKGKTENDLMRLPFRQVFAFRPGFIKPIPGLARANRLYKYINWLFPLGRALFPSGFCTLQELALAMIRVVKQGYERKIIEGKY